jgi:geranylgeranyl diphosphate synthase type I
VVAAHHLAGSSLRRQLAELMSARDVDEVDVGRWRSLITATGAPQWIEHMIEERLTRALDWIDSRHLDPLVRMALTSMAAACAQRAA